MKGLGLHAILLMVCSARILAQSSGAELVVQTGHSSSVRSIAFTRDGKILASLGLDNAIKIWDVATRKELRSIGNSEASAAVAISPDEKTIATVSFRTRSVLLFSISTGELIRRFPPVEDVVIWDMRFSPDGDTIATIGYYNQVRLFSIRTGTQIGTRHLGGRFGAFGTLAFSPDGRFLATPDERGLAVFEVHGTDGFAVPTTAERINVLAFDPDGKFLAIGDSNGDINIYDIAGRRHLRTLASDPSVGIFSLAFSSDRKTLARGSADGSITLFDLTGGMIVEKTPAHDKQVFALAFSPDGNILASGGGDDAIKFWDTRNGKSVGALAPISSLVYSVEFSPDGRYLALAREDGTVQLWNAETGNAVRVLSGHAGLVWTTAFSPNGKILASGSVDGTIRLWDVETGSLIRDPLHGHAGEVRRLAFSPDAVTLASGDSKGWIILWNLHTGERREITVPADPQEINALTFNRDGSILASGGWSGIKLWEVTSLNLLRDTGTRYSMAESIVFSRDGTMVAIKSNKRYDVVPAGSQYVEEGSKIRVMSVDRLTEVGSFELEDAAYRPQFEKQFTNGAGRFFYETWSDAMAAKVVLGSRVQIFTRPDRKELGSLVVPDNGRWTFVAADGRFDTNNSLDDIDGLHWIDRAEPFTPIPLEIFMRQYYEPGLFARLARCTHDGKCANEFKPLPSIADVNRVQPKLGTPRVSALRPNGTVDVSIDVEPVTKLNTRSGVFDLRLFVNRQLAASSVTRLAAERYIAATADPSVSEIDSWRRTHDLSPTLKFVDGRATYVFPNIRVPRDGQSRIEFSAYAFNADRVKSETVRTTLDMAAQSLRGRTVLITIGVNASESSKYRLDFAANDARRMNQLLASHLIAVPQDIVRINLISDYDGSGRLAENHATKAIIKGVFEIMAGRRDEVDAATLETIGRFGRLDAVRPEDTVIISFSGHGYTRGGVFYLLPYDIGEHTAGITREVLPRLISSDELSLWMREMLAKEIIFVVDACHSAASIQGPDFKPGPMGSRGLGQLAYDKGMRVLAATQTNNVALELRSLKHGLLSYALLEDGIVRGLADTELPTDGMLSAAEWLGYATKGVPSLYKKLIDGKSRLAISGNLVDFSKLNEKEKAETFCQGNNCRSKASVQQPVLFDFARPRRSAPMFRLPGKR